MVSETLGSKNNGSIQILNLNEIVNELPHCYNVQFSGFKINEFLPVI